MIVVPLLAWAASSLSGGDDAELGVEAFAGTADRAPEIVVALPSYDLNQPATTGGERSVGLECLDVTGDVVFRVEHIFPFTDTDGGTEPPHVHQRASPGQLAAVERCRLDDTDPTLEGTLETDPAP